MFVHNQIWDPIASILVQRMMATNVQGCNLEEKTTMEERQALCCVSSQLDLVYLLYWYVSFYVVMEHST